MTDEEIRLKIMDRIIDLHHGSAPDTKRLEQDLLCLYNFVKAVPKKQENEKVHKIDA